jgi:hypothetical protein
MSESRALVPQTLSPSVWTMITQVAPVLYQSRLFGVSSPDQAAAIMLKGAELGIGLAASFEFIQVIQGRPTLSPRGALALIQRSGELEDLKVDDQPDRCIAWMKRRNGPEYSATFTMDDAQRAGLLKAGSAWMSYPSNMLRWRAIGYAADVLFADITGGLKRR